MNPLKIKTSIELYLVNLVTHIDFDKENPFIHNYITNTLKDMRYDDSTLLTKYATLEKILASYKKIIEYLNDYNIDTYPKFSSLTPSYTADIIKRLKSINTFYDQLVAKVNEEYDVDILELKRTVDPSKIRDYISSKNIVLDLSKDQGSEVLEEVKDELINKTEYERLTHIISLYECSSFEKDFDRFFSTKPFTLATSYFERLSEDYKTNVIVINLTTKNKYNFVPLTQVDTVLNNDTIKNNTTIRKLSDTLIFDAPEVSFYPSVKKHKKYLILKLLGRVNFVMSRVYPRSADEALLNIIEHNRVNNYNSIIEDIFLKRDIIKKVPFINIPEVLSIERLKFSIMNQLKDIPRERYKEVILRVVQKQLLELFGRSIYSYISLYESLSDKLDKEFLKNRSLKDTLDVVFTVQNNIYKEIRDNILLDS